MDVRLQNVERDLRFRRLTSADLPLLARCLASFLRNKAHIRQVNSVVIERSGEKIAIIREDWEIIRDMLNSDALAAPLAVFRPRLTTSPDADFSVPVEDLNLYYKILHELAGKFPDFPTSRI